MGFKFSIVMAVYNVELFLEEAIESVIAQDIGFDQVQLILVDDGAKDSSGAICDRYAQRYPQNIFVIHKENGGVSSARNEGLRHVQGEYVNFLDADDKLSPQTLREVYAFFEKYGDQTDLACIPLRFFDAQTGDHVLNYKFNRGTRVIDLDREWANPQLSLSSAFVRWEVFSGLQFDARLCYAEDAQLVQRVLSHKCTLGVVAEGEYSYRRRSVGESSAIQASTHRSNWYLPYMDYFQLGTIEYYLERLGFVPKFVQYTLMYDLQWRIKLPDIPKGILTEEETEKYFEKIARVLTHIDDSIIMSQRNLWGEYKIFALQMKYANDVRKNLLDNDIIYCFGRDTVLRFSNSITRFEFLSCKANTITLTGVITPYAISHDIDSVSVLVNGKRCECEVLERQKPSKAMGRPVQYQYAFTAQFELDPSDGPYRISVESCVDGIRIPMHMYRFGAFFPVSTTYQNSYYVNQNWMFTVSDGVLLAQHARSSDVQKREKDFLKEIWDKRYQGGRKAVLARKVYRILKKMKRKPLWLISDRATKAGDNGEALFRYLRKNHPEIDARYVIDEHVPDYEAMKKIGPVLKRNSFKHKQLSLMSDYIISSHAEIEIYNPFYGHSEAYRDILANTRFIFLQHGVTNNDVSNWLNRFNKNLYGFITAAKPEYQSIVDGKYYFYTDKQVWLTGFPRFDRLYHDEKKRVTIMPTWRRYLMDSWNAETDVWSMVPGAEKSEYIQFYNNLLNHPRLLEAAKKYGYQIDFLPHPTMQKHLDVFKKNEMVKFLGLETAYRDIYAISDLVVTDYSSAVFDFAYLRKPVLYAHFDAETFFAGAHVYTKGYFDVERDGFGEVEYDLEGTVDRIIEYMSTGCKLKDKYRERIDRFFAFDDQNNCQRVYERILELEKETR